MPPESRRTLPGTLVFIAAILLVTPAAPLQAQDPAPPDALVGVFEDDYGARHVVADTTWTHGSSRYRVEAWHRRERRVLLTAPGDEGSTRLWLRIDWVVFGPEDGAGEGWGWAYCMAVWDAATAEDALAAPPSVREAPRTGCGDGFPFTRMRRVESGPGPGHVPRWE